MNLAPITMERAEARKAYLEYRDAIREVQGQELDEVRFRQYEQDKAIMEGYRALSVGRQLIRLSDAMAAAGFITEGEHAGMPHLAIMRADFPAVRCTRWQGGQMRFEPADNRTHRQASKIINVTTPQDGTGSRWSITRRATVPPIPPQFRPVAHPRNYHILFEGEWRNDSTPRAPADPALLKHLRGDLYAVLAIWDLTEVEKAALDGGAVLS